MSVEVRSEITGKVWKIESKVGDQVAVEDEIMILESMKMEIPVLVTSAGKITEFKVAEGDSVEEDQVLAILD